MVDASAAPRTHIWPEVIRAVATQYGMVTPDLRAFGDTFRQMHLLPFAYASLHDLRHGGGH